MAILDQAFELFQTDLEQNAQEQLRRWRKLAKAGLLPGAGQTQKAALVEKANSGVMVALFVPPVVARRIALSAGEPAEELHVTLAYLGKADDISPDDRLRLKRAVAGFARGCQQQRGEFNSLARFCNTGSDDGDAFVLIPDLPDLPVARQRLVGAIEYATDGRVQTDSNHGYVPHTTLAYLSKGKRLPFDRLKEPVPVVFSFVSLVLGDERYDYPLAAPVLAKALVKRLGGRHSAREYKALTRIIELAQLLGGFAYAEQAGRRHSSRDEAMIQEIHDLAKTELGAACKLEMPTGVVKPAAVLPLLRSAVLVERHARHNQKDHAGKKGGKGGVEAAFGELPANLANLRKKESDSIVGKLAKLDANTLSAALKDAEKLGGQEGFVKSGLLLKAIKKRRNDLVRQQAKAGLAEKGQTNAPNYQPASTARACENCRHSNYVKSNIHCNLFDFDAERGYVCDRWQNREEGQQQLTPGLSSRAGVFSLAQQVLALRGGKTSGNFGHSGRKGKHGGSKPGGGHSKVGIKQGDSQKEKLKKISTSRPESRPGKKGGGDTDPDTWSSRVSGDEADAILTYTTSKYHSINGGLRSGKVSKEDAKTIKSIDSAMEKSRLKKEMVSYENQKLYRAASIPEVNKALDSGNFKGFEFTEKGYTSTTTDKQIAQNFLRGEGSRLFRVKSPAGTKAANVSELSNLKGEKEVLIARNTRYKITGVEKTKEKIGYRDPKGKVRYRTKTVEWVTLEVVGQDGE